ncbi:MAG TPA: DUF488 domain-containing protein [Pseudomonas sp.]|jgi:uncharacterized protein YeaO (DUF488 family)|nr:DUF488 domain-containing protein [Pseudomonas sp.]
MIACKRVYEDASPEDGCRILVDRLWPRGIRKEALVHNDWLPELAPSAELRKTFGHDPDKFGAFKEAYSRELAAHPEHWWPLLERAGKGRLTLLYAAKDEQHNNAVVLAEFLEDALERQGPGSSPPCYAGE